MKGFGSNCACEGLERPQAQVRGAQRGLGETPAFTSHMLSEWKTSVAQSQSAKTGRAIFPNADFITLFVCLLIQCVCVDVCEGTSTCHSTYMEVHPSFLSTAAVNIVTKSNSEVYLAYTSQLTVHP